VKQVNISLSPKAQSIWDTSANDWRVIPDSLVYVGASSRDIRLKESAPRPAAKAKKAA
jgi:beta-glucosidase